MEARYWRPLADQGLVCELCPHRCHLKPGQSGLCQARRNLAGSLDLPLGGLVSALALDPIEKKPLFHFLPGSEVYSVGFLGCNLACPFCQNWRISQDFEPKTEGRALAPAELVSLALASKAPSLAFTYSEPSIHIEYLLEAASLARTAGLFTVLVTNGSLLKDPARDLLSLMDAVNVDLKTWSEASYRGVLKGDKATVLAFLEEAASLCHLEISTLVVPGISEDPQDLEAMVSFIVGLSPAIPFHLTAYHRDWLWDREPPSSALLLDLADRARRRLDYVYVGNLPGAKEDSLCPSCGAVLATHQGFRTRLEGLRPGTGLDRGLFRGQCASCGRDLPFFLQGP